MKKIFLSLAALAIVFTACNNDKKIEDNNTESANVDNDGMVVVAKPTVKEGEYVSLISGEKVNIIADPTTGIAVDSKTQIPVEFYYDPITLDTLYQNGMVVNRMLIKEGDGKYKLDDMKIKIDGDEIKIKTDTSKIKIDGDDMKIKSGDDKTKMDEQQMKVKSEEGKVKIDEEGVKVKPSN